MSLPLYFYNVKYLPKREMYICGVVAQTKIGNCVHDDIIITIFLFISLQTHDIKAIKSRRLLYQHDFPCGTHAYHKRHGDEIYRDYLSEAWNHCPLYAVPGTKTYADHSLFPDKLVYN